MRQRLFLFTTLLPAALLWGCGDAPSAPPAPERHPDPAIRQLQEFIAEHEAQAEPVGRIDRKRPNWKFVLPKPPQVEFTPGKTYFWELQTNKGLLRLRLLADVAPMHAANVLYLTLLGFYDGLPFHRAIQGFMVQGGCPAGNGRGDPGYRIDLEVSPEARHDRAGMLASANSGPNTDGSQFYITYAPQSRLDGGYTVFGEISEGMAALRALEADSAPPGGDDKPPAPLLLEKASFSVE